MTIFFFFVDKTFSTYDRKSYSQGSYRNNILCLSSYVFFFVFVFTRVSIDNNVIIIIILPVRLGSSRAVLNSIFNYLKLKTTIINLFFFFILYCYYRHCPYIKYRRPGRVFPPSCRRCARVYGARERVQ